MRRHPRSSDAGAPQGPARRGGRQPVLKGHARQRGIALLVLVGLIVLAGAAVLLTRLNAASQLRTNRERRTAEALAQAKQALIDWSVTHPDTPGRLPFPDRKQDPGAYDGTADCVTSGVVAKYLIGRFPWAGESGGGCPAAPLGQRLVDGYGQPLWYAVSRNMVANNAPVSGSNPINVGLADSAPYPWLVVRDAQGNCISDRVAAVIIAPGEPNRDPTLIDNSLPNPDIKQYLDSVIVNGFTYSNWDSDESQDAPTAPTAAPTAVCPDPTGEDFIISPDINDRIAYITIDELMRAVEKRVIGAVAQSLETYRTTYGAYPWLSPYANVRSGDSAHLFETGGAVGTAQAGSGSGTLVDNSVGVDFVAAGVKVGDSATDLSASGPGGDATGTVTAVSAHTLAVSGGVSFAAGDEYAAGTHFNGRWDAHEGHIPFTEPGKPYAFRTGFTVNLNNSGSPAVTLPGLPYVSLDLPSAASVQVHMGAAITAGSVTVPPPDSGGTGVCIWTTGPQNVDCRATIGPTDAGYTVNITVCVPVAGCLSPITALSVQRTITMNLNFNGTLTPDGNANENKSRTVVASSGTQTVHIQDSVRIPSNALSFLAQHGISLSNPVLGYADVPVTSVSGIHYDLTSSDLPAWFLSNEWYRYVYAAYAPSYAGGGTAPADCVPGAGGNPPCLTIDVQNSAGTVVGTRHDGRLVVIGAGPALSGQDRAGSGGIADYFEQQNVSPNVDIFSSGVLSTSFNDQVRVFTP